MAYKLLMETSNPADIALIRSLLDAEGILFFVQGEGFHAVRPLLQPVRFLVAEDRFDDAEEMIRGLRLSYGPFSSGASEGGDGTPDDR